MNLCEEVGLLKTTLMLKNIFEIIIIVVPLILIVMAMIDLGKVVIGNSDKINEAVSSIIKRFIAAVVVFFVPTTMMTLVGIISDNTVDAKKVLCWNEATSENIEALELALEAEKMAEKQEYEKEKDEYLSSLVVPESSLNNNSSSGSSSVTASYSMTPFVNGVQRALQAGDCMTAEDSCSCPTIGKFKGFYFKMATEKGRSMSEAGNGDPMITVKVECSDGTYISKTVNSKAEDNFRQAFEKICKLKTTGISGVKIASDMLRIDGTLVKRTTSSRTICSPHAYGIAIDINYDLVITIDGVDYKPYASQGYSTKKRYDEFVSVIGSETNKKNVNYILWKYAFEPSGFTWGGKWSDGSFDPMHYEVAQ